jgi:hypothetical protein
VFFAGWADSARCSPAAGRAKHAGQVADKLLDRYTGHCGWELVYGAPNATPEMDVKNTETLWAEWNEFKVETSWQTLLRLLGCESGCSTREGVSCIVHRKRVCVAVSWTTPAVQVRQTSESLQWIICFLSLSRQESVQSGLRVCEPRCLGSRPFIVTHFNTIVWSCCHWLWRAVVSQLAVLSWYWADYCQPSSYVVRQVKLLQNSLLQVLFCNIIKMVPYFLSFLRLFYIVICGIS